MCSSDLERALTIYGIVDPTNSEQPFLSACLFSKTGHPDQAVAALKKAIDMGLKQRSKIENEPSFVTLRDREDFNRLLQELR